MAHQGNSDKVAEDFAGPMRRRPQEKPAQEKILDCQEAAKKYGGVLEVRGQGSVPQGGVLIMDYTKRKSKFMAY